MATRAQTARAVDHHLAAATAVGKKRHRRGDVAVAATYETRTNRLHIELASGVAFIVPISKVQGLADAKPSVVRSIKLTGRGYGLHWPELDLDVSVPDLVAGCFGTKAWMAALARQGGRSKSRAKTEAARKNGLKGGRPRKEEARETLAPASVRVANS